MITDVPHKHYANSQPEKLLWAAVLASYVQDVIAYSSGKLTADKATNEQLRLAYKDFRGRQTTLARLCGFCDLEREWVSRQVMRQIT